MVCTRRGDGDRAERCEIALHVRHPERRGKVAQVREQRQPVAPLEHLAALLLGKAGGDEVLDPPLPVDRRDHAGAGAGQRPRAVDHLLQHGPQVEARADAQDRRAQPRGAVPARVSVPHCSTRLPKGGAEPNERLRRSIRPRSAGPGGEWRIAGFGR